MERFVGLGISGKLDRDVTAQVGERVLGAAAHFTAQGQHAFQDFADRGAVVFGNPAAKLEEVAVEDRLSIAQA